MKHLTAIGLTAFVLALQVPPAIAETCPSQNSAQAQTKDKAEPAASGKDGVGTTDMSGGHGASRAGIENQKQPRAPNYYHSDEAKGLDLKMESQPKAKC